MKISSEKEYKLSYLGIALGACVAAALAPKDIFFFPNFAIFWGSQLLVLALLFLFRPRPAIVGGMAVALSIYLAIFGCWVFWRARPESMLWIFYLMSLPGAVGAILLGTANLMSRSRQSVLKAAFSGATLVSLGLIFNLTIIYIFML
jgi:hypothetical protein